MITVFIVLRTILTIMWVGIGVFVFAQKQVSHFNYGVCWSMLMFHLMADLVNAFLLL